MLQERPEISVKLNLWIPERSPLHGRCQRPRVKLRTPTFLNICGTCPLLPRLIPLLTPLEVRVDACWLMLYPLHAVSQRAVGPLSSLWVFAGLSLPFYTSIHRMSPLDPRTRRRFSLARASTQSELPSVSCRGGISPHHPPIRTHNTLVCRR